MQYMTLPGLRPAAVAPRQDRLGPSCARETFQLDELKGVHNSIKIQEITPGFTILV